MLREVLLREVLMDDLDRRQHSRWGQHRSSFVDRGVDVRVAGTCSVVNAHVGVAKARIGLSSCLDTRQTPVDQPLARDAPVDGRLCLIIVTAMLLLSTVGDGCLEGVRQHQVRRQTVPHDVVGFRNMALLALVNPTWEGCVQLTPKELILVI